MSRTAPLPGQSPAADLTGFWKVKCSDGFGVRIAPAGGKTYSLSFCGPGGCFEPGSWTPNSPIYGDGRYRVVDQDHIQFPYDGGFLTYRRCAGNSAAPEPATDEPAEPLNNSHFKPYYEGLPDLDAHPPFAFLTSAEAETLRSLSRKARGDSGCPKPAVSPKDVRELCGNTQRALSDHLRTLSRGLPPGEFSHTFLADLDLDGADDLLVQYDVEPKGETDRYAAFFAFVWTPGGYQVRSASWFLEGALHAVAPFGPTPAKKVFLRLLSCTECEPWVYLTVCDLTVGPSGVGFEFTYNEDGKDEYEPRIEYELPGMGHSIDAKVETRVPTDTGTRGPHLLQYYDVEDGEDEWWSFTCSGAKCTPTVIKGKGPPKAWRDHWRLARPL